MSACNVTFWKDKDRGGHHKTYDGAQNVSDLNYVQWYGEKHDDMKDDIGSISTSSQTWVRVYSKAHYQGRTALIGPNTNKNMKDILDDSGQYNMDDTIESFQLHDRKPTVNTTNIINNLLKLYPGSVHSRKDDLYNSEFYTQDSNYRIYDPIINLDNEKGKVSFRIKLDHIQSEKDDHAVVTFSMDYRGNFMDEIKVEYTMAAAIAIPAWAIKIIDGAIDIAADTAKIIADAAEVVVTDGVGIVAVVETDELIDITAKAITFCVDHLNTVLSSIFSYQDDGGAMYFPAAVSQCIARSILAYYQELFGQDTNPIQKFNETNFLTTIGVQNWNTSKHNPYAEFDLELVKHSIPESYTYRSYYPDYTFLYAQGGAIISAKVDAVTDYRKDDHLTLQVTFDPKGRLFSIIGSIDLFDRIHDKGYTPPTSGLLTYNDQGQIIRVSQGGKQIFGYDSLINAYIDQFRNSLEQTHTDRITVQQTGLIEASLKVVAAIEAAL